MADNFRKICEIALSATDQFRRDRQHRRFDVYQDNYDYLINILIKKQFHEENADRLYPMVCNYANLLKKIVNLKSVLYKHEAKREWLDGSNEPDEGFSELLEESNIHIAFQSLNKYLNINNTAFMRIMPDLENKGIRYEAIPSENIVVLRRPDNPYEIDAVLHHIILDDLPEHQWWYYWDAETHCRLTNDLSKKSEEGPNLWIDPNTKRGIIPYIPSWSIQPLANSFWCETTNDDLYNATLQVNVHLTHLNNLMKASCYKQWVFTGMIVNDIKALYGHVTDGLNPICLQGDNAKAQTEEMTGDIMAAMSVIHDLTAQVCDQHGISFSSQSTSAQKQSGIALSIEREALDNLREEQEPRLRECEKRVAWASVVIANQVFKSGIDVEGQFRLTFGHDPQVMTPDDTAAEDWKLSKGLKPVTDIYRDMNPGVTDDEAAEKAIKDNLAKNKELSAADTGHDELKAAFGKVLAGGTTPPPGEEGPADPAGKGETVTPAAPAPGSKAAAGPGKAA